MARNGRTEGSRVRSLALVLFGIASGAGVLAACSKSDSAPENACSGASALSYPAGNNDGFQGGTLSPKQLVFTFDDGPGGQTVALSAYLKSQGIRATFFVNGHCFGANVATYPQCQQSTAAVPADIFTQVVADGHLVGNHTQDHRDLTSTTVFPVGAAGDTAIVNEVVDTDNLISPFFGDGRIFFRPPFGAWNTRDYGLLHGSAMDKYVGPVKWDIGGAMTGPLNGSDDQALNYGADWDCWQNTHHPPNGPNGYGVKTTKGCATRYLQEIAYRKKGIVLFHDADYGDVNNHDLTSGKGNTPDLVKLLVEGDATLGITGLKAQGYTFLRLDEVPEINALLPPLPPPDAGYDGPVDAADASVPPAGDAANVQQDSNGTSSIPLDPCAPHP
jgi:peptidoglycan/xylan/chitin deacetylase (PgdA/CDA1 family)